MNYKHFVGLLILIALTALLIFNRPAEAGPNTPAIFASSTTFALTTTSQQLFATSSKRIAVAVQPTNCTVGGTVYMNLEGYDKAAVASDGFAVLASTTARFSDFDEFPTPQEAVRGIVDAGTCTVLVTEWIQR